MNGEGHYRITYRGSADFQTEDEVRGRLAELEAVGVPADVTFIRTSLASSNVEAPGDD